jgi:translation initiation factor IF-2
MPALPAPRRGHGGPAGVSGRPGRGDDGRSCRLQRPSSRPVAGRSNCGPAGGSTPGRCRRTQGCRSRCARSPPVLPAAGPGGPRPAARPDQARTPGCCGRPPDPPSRWRSAAAWPGRHGSAATAEQPTPRRWRRRPGRGGCGQSPAIARRRPPDRPAPGGWLPYHSQGRGPERRARPSTRPGAAGAAAVRQQSLSTCSTPVAGAVPGQSSPLATVRLPVMAGLTARRRWMDAARRRAVGTDQPDEPAQTTSTSARS